MSTNISMAGTMGGRRRCPRVGCWVGADGQGAGLRHVVCLRPCPGVGVMSGIRAGIPHKRRNAITVKF